MIFSPRARPFSREPSPQAAPRPRSPGSKRLFIVFQNTYHAALPFCHYDIRVPESRLNGFILRKKGLVRQPGTLGEHLRNRRLALGLRQKDAAERLGTIREVYERWERDARQPVVSEWPGILSLLGYYPFPVVTLADLVLKARRCQGADQKRLADVLGVIHQKFRRWEGGLESVAAPFLNRLERLAQLQASA